MCRMLILRWGKWQVGVLLLEQSAICSVDTLNGLVESEGHITTVGETFGYYEI